MRTARVALFTIVSGAMIALGGCGSEPVATPAVSSTCDVQELVASSEKVIHSLGEVLKLSSSAMKNPVIAESVSQELDKRLPQFQLDNAHYESVKAQCEGSPLL